VDGGTIPHNQDTVEMTEIALSIAVILLGLASMRTGRTIDRLMDRVSKLERE
jgi:hypothetical protein